MSRLPLADRVTVAAQRRASRALIQSGRRVLRLSARTGGTRAERVLQLTGRRLTVGGKAVGVRSRARRKAAKRRVDAETAAEATRETARTARGSDLRPVIAERHREDTDLVRTELARLAARDDPVLVGPFHGEVGFELLYWVPFVKWMLREYPRLRGRLIVASRGGTRAWYGEGVRDYVDMLDVFSPEEFVERQGDELKQREVSALDADFLSAMAERFGLRDLQHVHPSLMWSGYYRAIKADERSYARAVHSVAEGVATPLLGLRSVYTPIARPPVGILEGTLPDQYVAARFYFGHAFPDSPENRALATSVLRGLSERVPVVLLNNRLTLDDHTELDFDSPRVVALADHMSPATNLHVQTIAVSRARAFVGSYGGLSYLAPHLGVPSLAFDSAAARPWHLDLARQVFRGPPWGSLAVLTPRDREALELLTGSLPGAARESGLPIASG
jgi:hypothetical protein